MLEIKKELDNKRIWIENRRGYLGGTDAAAILGKNPYKSPLQVWCEKTNKIAVKNLDDNLAVQIGIHLEDSIATLFENKTGHKTRRVNQTMVHEDYPFICANIDRKITNEPVLLEIKTGNIFQKKEYDKGTIPDQYYWQCLHYLNVTKYESCYLYVILNNRYDYLYEIIAEDHKENMKHLLDAEINFWENYVKKNIMPAVSSIDEEVLDEIYQEKKEYTISLDSDVERIIIDLDAIKNHKKQLEAEEQLLKNQILAKLQDFRCGKTDRHIITNKTTEMERLDTTKLKETHEDIYKECLKKISFNCLKIKKI